MHTDVAFHDLRSACLPGQVFCVFLFTFAASLFGTLLGEIQQVFATLNKKAKELEEYMEGYQNFFWDYKYSSMPQSALIQKYSARRASTVVKHTPPYQPADLLAGPSLSVQPSS